MIIYSLYKKNKIEILFVILFKRISFTYLTVMNFTYTRRRHGGRLAREKRKQNRINAAMEKNSEFHLPTGLFDNEEESHYYLPSGLLDDEEESHYYLPSGLLDDEPESLYYLPADIFDDKLMLLKNNDMLRASAEEFIPSKTLYNRRRRADRLARLSRLETKATTGSGTVNYSSSFIPRADADEFVPYEFIHQY